MGGTFRDAITFPRFAAITTGMTLTLVMLGIYTAATGSGLACSAQWPLCDNGLLPQTIPSFVEWFHRLVAMVTGGFIVATALWSWRRSDRGTRLSATAAVCLLPLQISIGAVTVTLNGLLPGGYSAPTQGAHLVVALTIFSLLVWSTLSGRKGRAPERARIRQGLAVALVTVVASVFVSRVFTPVPYSPTAQAIFYGVGLVAVAALLAVTRWLGATPVAHLRYVTTAALLLVFGGMLLGRDLVFYTPTVRLLNATLFVLAAVAIVVVGVLTRSGWSGERASVGHTSGSD
jgi:cytochrome c oxidase assembly protein subunit 15